MANIGRFSFRIWESDSVSFDALLLLLELLKPSPQSNTFKKKDTTRRSKTDLFDRGFEKPATESTPALCQKEEKNVKSLACVALDQLKKGRVKQF
jgi:hypothetical protein